MTDTTIPPCDTEAETDLVLGVVSAYSAPPAASGDRMWGELAEVVESLDSRDFYRTSLGLWWAAVQEIVGSGKMADVKAVREVLTQSGARGSEAFNDVASLISGGVQDLFFAPAILAQRVQRIVDRASARRLREAALRIAAKVDTAAPADECVAFAASAVAAVEENTWKDDGSSDSLLPAIDEIVAIMRGKGQEGHVPTGYPSLDAMLGGLRGGQVFVLAGRPGMGKSSLAFNIMGHAIRAGIKPLVFSMEMLKSEVLQSMSSILSGVPLETIRSSGASEETIQKVYEAALEHEGRLFVNDIRGMTPRLMMTHAKRLRRRQGVGLIVIDHIGLIKPPGRKSHGSRENEVGEISREIKVMAGQLNVPIIAVCQLNRQAEGREDKRPRLSDLRESGSIEQDADIVGGVYRPGYYWPENPEFDGKVELLIMKHRGGRTGKVHLAWDGDRVTFSPPRVVTMGGFK